MAEGNAPHQDFWQYCVQCLRATQSEDHLSALTALEVGEHEGAVALYAPNEATWLLIKDHLLGKIKQLAQDFYAQDAPKVKVLYQRVAAASVSEPEKKVEVSGVYGNVSEQFRFDSFVEGPNNEYAKAAAMNVAQNPGKAYNPLFICGGVGLGKTHLSHAVGNYLIQERGLRRVCYVHAERFVSDMIVALQRNRMDGFKAVYRSLDALLIDDVQFFAGKHRTQEEFFHTFNALFDMKQQIILTSDRNPQELNGLEERLRSRFSWGLTVAIKPPDFETRVAILHAKALSMGVTLTKQVAFFIAKHVYANVRELEGALNRVVAHARFADKVIDEDFVHEVLNDLVLLHTKRVSIEGIKEAVAKYYGVKQSDLLSKRRSKMIVFPRQVAMFLAKTLTQKSLPDIGNQFGGRDHTTVLHSVRKITALREQSVELKEDIEQLLRLLQL
jgi:chromosomal replication initiator protein